MSTHRTRGQERADELDVSPAALTAEIERITGERDAARKQADDYLAGLQRERAEFVNFKRRTNEEREAMLGLAAESLLSKVVAVADDFDLALDARPATIAADPWVEGIGAIDRKLRAVLDSEGVRPIDASPGQPFDPHLHEAITSSPGTGLPEGTIAAEIRRGYRLRDRVLRPALVAVAAASPDGDQPSTGGPPPDERAPGAGPTTNTDHRTH
ncbi:MAG TPA: nucleotide exchange factor GrpE [Nonomuraea sp.]|nr:nucleotide exchange factor GrpE [Nonomuraea sp.]